MVLTAQFHALTLTADIVIQKMGGVRAVNQDIKAITVN